MTYQDNSTYLGDHSEMHRKKTLYYIIGTNTLLWVKHSSKTINHSHKLTEKEIRFLGEDEGSG